MQLVQVKTVDGSTYVHEVTDWKTTADGILTMMDDQGNYTLYSANGWIRVMDIKEGA